MSTEAWKKERKGWFRRNHYSESLLIYVDERGIVECSADLFGELLSSAGYKRVSSRTS